MVLEVFRSCLSRRGDKGRDDLLFLRAMHHFTVQKPATGCSPFSACP